MPLSLGIGLGITEGGGFWTPAALGASLRPAIVPSVSRTMGRLWQDSGKTTAAVADGDPVRVATCPFTGSDYAAPSDAARPVLHTDGAGHWWLTFDGVDDTMSSTFAGAIPFSASVRAKNNGTNNGQTLNGTAWLLGPYGGGGGNANFFVGSFVGAGVNFGGNFGTATGTGAVNDARFYANGTQSGATFTGTVGHWGAKVWVGSNGGTQEFASVHVAGAILDLSLWDTATRQRVEAYLGGLA